MGIGTRVEGMLSRFARKAQTATAQFMSIPEGTPRTLTPQDNLLALDNTGFRVDGQWVAEFVISVFDRYDEERAHKLEEQITTLLRLKKGEVRWSRIGYFACVPRQNVSVNLRQADPAGTDFTVGPTQHNGIMSPERPIPNYGEVWKQGDTTVFDVVLPPEFPEAHNHTTVFGEELGYGVISGPVVRCSSLIV